MVWFSLSVLIGVHLWFQEFLHVHLVWPLARRAQGGGLPRRLVHGLRAAHRGPGDPKLRLVHIYLISLIPLGHWRHWECPHCEKHPHLKGIGLLQAIIVALIFLPFFLTAILFWTLPPVGMDGDNVWMIRIFLTVMCLVMGYWAYAYQRDPSLKQRLAQIEPASETVCVNCGSALRPSKPPYCETCQMERAAWIR